MNYTSKVGDITMARKIREYLKLLNLTKGCTPVTAFLALPKSQMIKESANRQGWAVTNAPVVKPSMKRFHNL